MIARKAGFFLSSKPVKRSPYGSKSSGKEARKRHKLRNVVSDFAICRRKFSPLAYGACIPTLSTTSKRSSVEIAAGAASFNADGMKDVIEIEEVKVEEIESKPYDLVMGKIANIGL
jgi:hypothetical protein